MSGKMVGWAMDQVTGSPTTKLVLVKLADNANEEGYCFPSIDLMVKHTELSERAVRKHLYELERLDLIRIERRQEDGVHFRNRYHLNAFPEERKGKNNGIAPRATPYEATNREVEQERPTVNAPVLHEVQEGGLSVQGPLAPGAAPVLHEVQDVLHEVPSHIEEPSTEPPNEPPTQPTQTRAREGDLEMPSFLRRVWPEGLKAFMDVGAWHSSSSASQAEDAWRDMRDAPPWPYLVRSAETYFARLADANGRRRKDDPQHAVSAQRFVRDRMWNDHPPAEAASPGPQLPLAPPPWDGHPAAKQMRAELGAGMFDTWLAPCRLDIREGVVTLQAPRKLIRDYVAIHFLMRLERAFDGMPVAIVLADATEAA